jgi:hypothetical protein
MYKFYFLLISLTISLNSYEQGKYKTFTIVLITPDTANLDESILNEIKPIEKQYQKNTDKKEDQKFKWFHFISLYSKVIYNLYFNQGASTVKVFEVKYKLENTSYRILADSLNADYLISYKNIHTERNNDSLSLKATTILYSRIENAVLFDKETTVNSDSMGDLWTCNSVLSCLLINTVRESTEGVFSEISKRSKL